MKEKREWGWGMCVCGLFLKVLGTNIYSKVRGRKWWLGCAAYVRVVVTR